MSKREITFNKKRTK